MGSLIRVCSQVGGCIPRRTFSLRGNHPKGKNKAEKSEPVPGGSSKELNVSKESLVLDRRRKRKTKKTSIKIQQCHSFVIISQINPS